MLVSPPNFICKLFPSLIWRKETEKKEVWLTFDDGPTEEVTPWILQLLAKIDIKATFFLIGKEIEKHPKLYKEILDAGHCIGNHSYTHRNGLFTRTKTYLNDVEKCNSLMKDNKLFRPPFGKLRMNQIKLLKKKYKIIIWSILSWDFNEKIDAIEVEKNVLNNVRPGSIIVFHNNKKSFKSLQKTLELILRELQTKGYHFSTTW